MTLALHRQRAFVPLTVTGTLALLLFAWLADGASENRDLSRLDPTVTAHAVMLRTGLLTAVAQFFTTLGSTPGLTALTVVVSTVLARRGRWAHVTVLVATMVGSATLTVALKLVFARQRPPVADLIGSPASTLSFPSGHSFNTVAFVGVLAGFVLASGASRTLRVLAVSAATATALLVGLSRIYLGYHWMTDVLGGWVLGLAWLAVVGLAGLWWRTRRRRRLPIEPAPTALAPEDPAAAAPAAPAAQDATSQTSTDPASSRPPSSQV